MSTVFYSNKDEIRNRVIKKAQEIWGIHKVYDFDPLVTLMLEVLSDEIFNVSNDVRNLENRIFDKISRILASDNLVSPLPAHGILYVKPIDDQQKLAPNTHFFFKKKLNIISEAGIDKVMELAFSVVSEMVLFNGHIKYLVTPSNFYEARFNGRFLQYIFGDSVRFQK